MVGRGGLGSSPCGCNWFSSSLPLPSACSLAVALAPVHPFPDPLFLSLRFLGAPHPSAFPSTPGPACFLAVCPRR